MKAINHYKDRIGQKFGRLTILEYHPNKRKSSYLCKCDCGRIKEIKCEHIVQGLTKSCGCLSRELKSQRSSGNKYSVKHNKSRTRLYKIWCDMIQRCHNPKQKVYKWYGAIGIKVCEERKNDYTLFEKWALENGYDDVLTIDRIDFNGNYEPNNCRWVSMKEQSRNKKDTIKIEYKGKTQCLLDWCKELGKNYQTTINRINNGWLPKYALIVPKNIRRGSEKYNEIITYCG